MEDELKGTSKRGLVNHPQIYRRLCKTRLGVMKQSEIYSYLDLLEKEYAVCFTQEARRDLYQLCSDRSNGGLGNFIEILELAFTLVRPEWKSISFQLNRREYQHNLRSKSMFNDAQGKHKSETTNFDSEADTHLEPIDVSQLNQVTISHEVIISALDYKMTK
ncbi:MAG: hypothetical protein LUI10_09450 [Lachnospiraceae bacterium]|nr:hypothetical protein [Lachnospiraceae bacterium]